MHGRIVFRGPMKLMAEIWQYYLLGQRRGQPSAEYDTISACGRSPNDRHAFWLGPAVNVAGVRQCHDDREVVSLMHAARAHRVPTVRAHETNFWHPFSPILRHRNRKKIKTSFTSMMLFYSPCRIDSRQQWWQTSMNTVHCSPLEGLRCPKRVRLSLITARSQSLCHDQQVVSMELTLIVRAVGLFISCW